MSHKAPALQPGDTGGAPVARRGLRSNSLTLGPVVALGLAYMSLAPAVYFNMGFMEADANGPVMPLVFIVVTVAILPTALSFAALNRRRLSAGSALTWVTESLGLSAGLWSGFLLATLYVCACAIYPAYMAIFFNPLLEYFHADATFVTGLAGGIGATILVAWMLARNIQLSARAIAVFMVFEAAFVLVFSLYTVFFQVGHSGIAHPHAGWARCTASTTSRGMPRWWRSCSRSSRRSWSPSGRTTTPPARRAGSAACSSSSRWSPT
jgi:amino acid transporter